MSSDSHEEVATASFYAEINCVKTSILENKLLKVWSLESLGIQVKIPLKRSL